MKFNIFYRNKHEPAGPLTSNPQAKVVSVSLGSHAAPGNTTLRPPTHEPPTPPTLPKNRNADIRGLEGLAITAAQRLGVKKLTGFRRENDGRGTIGVAQSMPTGFTRRLFFKLMDEFDLKLDLRKETIAELQLIEREIAEFTPTLYRFACTPENARRLMAESQEKLGADFFSLQGNYSLAYEILSNTLNEKKRLFNGIRAKRAPLVSELGKAIKKVLGEMLQCQLDRELKQALQLEIYFCPSGLLATLFEATEVVQLQINIAEKSMANAALNELFWGIISEYLAQEKS